MNPQNLDTYLNTKDFLVTKESFSLLHDPEMDMLITFPKPKPEDLGRYYETDEYISHTDSGSGFMAFLYQTIKKVALKRKVRLIRKLCPSRGTLADLGAGTASFLDVSKTDGWIVQGAEPNPKAREIADSKGIKLVENISDLEGSLFDVVTLWHVLEHIPNLNDELAVISSLVKPGGSLVIAVPNFKSFDAKYYGEYWAAYDVPRHLWHFSKSSMEKLFEDGLEFIKSEPMVFDSFYVSLLSEKYKTGNTFSIRALLIGLWSNLKAWRTKESSSHIYLFKKPN